MKALMCNSLGLPNTLVFQETADPQPGPGQVVVDMKAAGVKEGLWRFLLALDAGVPE